MTDIIEEVSIISQYVICERCKVLISDVDNLDKHVCEAAAAAVANDGGGEMAVKSSTGYQCEYCNKTFAQVTAFSEVSPLCRYC